MTKAMSEEYRTKWERWWIKHLRAIGKRPVGRSDNHRPQSYQEWKVWHDQAHAALINDTRAAMMPSPPPSAPQATHGDAKTRSG